MLMNLTAGGVQTPPNTERLFQKKPFAFQYLSWNVHKKIQLGFYQGIMWNAADDKNRLNTGLGFFNPLIFGSVPFLDMDDEKNVMIGSNLRWRIYKGLTVYGQYMADDFGKGFHNKSGWQLGVKYADAFGAENLHLQLEYSKVRPYSYAHFRKAQSYTHYSQPLAHPLGANFAEAVGIIDYKLGDFFLQFKFTNAVSGRDSSGFSFGGNIFTSDSSAFSVSATPVSLPYGRLTFIVHTSASIGYTINPASNMNIVLGADLRTFNNNQGTRTNSFVYLALRTSLRNIYTDF